MDNPCVTALNNINKKRALLFILKNIATVNHKNSRIEKKHRKKLVNNILKYFEYRQVNLPKFDVLILKRKRGK